MKYFKKYLPYILIVLLFIVSAWFIYHIFSNSNNRYLKVIFLDVGQGDAIYVEAPNGKQMLIDGGPDTKVLPQLAKVMPFGDRSIDILVATHPDSDHIGGLPSVIDDYKIGGVLENGATTDTQIYQNLENKITSKNIKKIIARTGMKIILDKEKNIYFEILFPDRDVSNMDSNDGSIVGKLVYGNESFMLTGDATKYTENLIEWNEGHQILKSNVLKLGHHGSRTSSSVLWLEDVHPDVAIISAGKNNRYGHPHKETLDELSSLRIPFLATYIKGNIIFKTDGVNLIY
jgi:competence protein ComEC